MTTYTEHQQRLIAEHRDINVDHDWWDYMYEQFIAQCELFGIGISTRTVTWYSTHHKEQRSRREPEIYFEVYSQSAGACFKHNSLDVATLLQKGREAMSLPADHDLAYVKTSDEPVPKALRKMFEMLEQDFGVYSLSAETNDILSNTSFGCSGHESRGCYSGVMDLNVEYQQDESDLDEAGQKLLQDLTELAEYKFYSRSRRESGPLTEALRSIADALHKELEDEYDHLTSDEAVWDAIEANDLDEPEEEDEDEEDEDEEDVCQAA